MLTIFYSGRDLLFRIKLRLLSSHRYSIDDSLKSDSQKSNYIQAVTSIIENTDEFNHFRRKSAYREILEHVDFKLGRRYLNSILNIQNDLREPLNWGNLAQNDEVGHPVRYRFPSAGKVSPTTLRYVNVALQVKKLFGVDPHTFVEIGAGYGGQARIFNEFFEIESYTIFDLPEVNNLIEKYLSHFRLFVKVRFAKLERLQNEKWDVAISNYAFSELPRNLQLEYVHKVFLNSKRGFVIMNSGKTNFTGRSLGKLTASELTDLIPGSELMEENPITGPDNYLLVWGAEESKL